MMWLITNMGKWSSSASNLNTLVSHIVNVKQVIIPMISFVTASGLLRFFLQTPLGLLHALSPIQKAKDSQDSLFVLQKIHFCRNLKRSCP